MAPLSALLQLAMFLWHTGSQEKARACAERALEQTPGDIQGLSLLGWILIHPHKGAHASHIDSEDSGHALSLFEQVLTAQPKHVEVRYLMTVGSLSSKC